MDMIVHLRNPEGMFIQGDGHWVGNNGEYGIEFTQHKDNPMTCGVLNGYIPGPLCREAFAPDRQLARQMLSGKNAGIERDNIALVILVGEAAQ